MYKTLLLGGLATSFLAAVVALAVTVFGANGEVTGLLVVLGACGAGLIGSEVARRMPPRRH